MKSLRRLVLFFVSVFMIGVCFVFTSPAQAISGGDLAVRGQIPSFVGLFQLESQGGYSCGGVLVAPDRVLTAAHCIDELGEDIDLNYVAVGDGSIPELKSWAKQHPYGVTGVVQLPDYKLFDDIYGTVRGDMAVLRLERPVEGAAVAQISDTPIKVGGIYQGFGHGATTNDSSELSDPLKTVKLRNIDSTSCSAKISQNVPGGVAEGTECFEPERVGSEDSVCSGDSGSPLVDAKGHVVAVTSWATNTMKKTYCADRSNPVQAFQDVVRYKQMILDPHLFDLIPATVNSRIPVTTVTADQSLSTPLECRLANGEVPENWKIGITGGSPELVYSAFFGNKKDNPDGKISIPANRKALLLPATWARCDIPQIQVPGAPTGYKTMSSTGNDKNL
ncbi:S1 family peptidase [Psychromicrobium sp. YIM B11713]|uniref:S1 family peptidase n=1 Tax=Psychromicrobium sp. YIM B11713 TaxID=3145233 RepID=UPI00374FD035